MSAEAREVGAAAGSVAEGAGPALVVAFRDMEAGHLDLVGGKGHVLGRLSQSGFPVPDGFCVTTEAMRLFILEGGLSERLGTIAKRVREGGLDAQESWAFLGDTRELMAEAPLPERIREAVRSAYVNDLGEHVVAVRSSGTREDLEGASFAGQYESFLNVRGMEFLEQAIRRCWASIWRNRVLMYSDAVAGGVEDLAMGVVVQRLVKAEASGVLFTVDPLTGRDDRMLVEATFGLGETLVSGKVNPDRSVLCARTGAVIEHEAGAKRVRLRPLYSRDSRGESYEGLEEEGEEEVPDEEHSEPAVSPAELARLADLGGRIQEEFGRPMDVEWALEAGELHVVQARPITKLSFAAELGEWTNANFKDGGVASDVCAPLTASLYDRVFNRTMTEWFVTLRLIGAEREIEWFRVFFAKPYWNVGEVKSILLRVPGFIERDFDEDLGLERTYEGRGRATPLTPAVILGALPVLFAVRRAYRERLEIAKRFVGPFIEEYEALDALDLDELPREELLERTEHVVGELHLRTESAYFLTIYALTNSKIDFKVLFDAVNRAAGGELSYLNLISGLSDIAHLRPYKELCRLAREATAAGEEPDLASFLQRWGYHSTRELDLRVPRWREDPDFVEEALRRYRDAALEDPAVVEERQVALYEEESARLARALGRPALLLRPLLRWRFNRGLRRIREYAWWREEMRDCSMRCYWLVRKFVLALGRRLTAEGALERAEDVLMLSREGLIDLARGRLEVAAAKDEVAWQRRYLRSFRHFDNPNEVGGGHRFDGATRAAAAREGALTGVPGSSGTLEGTVRVVKRLEEAGKVEPGDVLVTVFTDPGWTPLMSLAGALVTETGGLLSHAAVISREYGIPAVLACTGATSALTDGERVLVDGGAGTVSKIGR